MRNIKLIIRFDGTAYHGWQSQKNALAVQDVVAAAINGVCGESSKPVGCGRTDTGVHAVNYVLSFTTESQIPAEKLPFAINSKLPKDIVCLSAEEMTEDFSAANSALAKKYTYLIYNSEIADPFYLNRAWHYKYPLDFEAMQKACEAFIGEHDFAGFASSGLTVKTTVRTVYSLKLSKSGNLIKLDITGNGFLYNMVRIITGTLVFVGSGKIAPEQIPDIISSCDRERAGITAPPEGLYLSEVYYEKNY